MRKWRLRAHQRPRRRWHWVFNKRNKDSFMSQRDWDSFSWTPSSVQLLSFVPLFVTPCTAARQASLSITNSRSLLKLMPTELVMPSNISSYVIPFSSCFQSFPASGSFQMSQFFTSGGQSIAVSASAPSVLPMNTQGWSPLGLTDLISLQSKGLSRVFMPTVWKHQFIGVLVSLWSNSHIHACLLEKP